jgi:hypothetical protein
MEPEFRARGLAGRFVVPNSEPRSEFRVVAPHCISRIALPSNKSMELTVKSVMPFAFAKVTPLSPAAHACR